MYNVMTIFQLRNKVRKTLLNFCEISFEFFESRSFLQNMLLINFIGFKLDYKILHASFTFPKDKIAELTILRARKLLLEHILIFHNHTQHLNFTICRLFKMKNHPTYCKWKNVINGINCCLFKTGYYFLIIIFIKKYLIFLNKII